MNYRRGHVLIELVNSFDCAINSIFTIYRLARVRIFSYSFLEASSAHVSESQRRRAST